MKLNYLFLLLIFLLPTATTQAYNPVINIVTVPYSVTAVGGSLSLQREFLGELKNDPHMYEFVVGSSTELYLRLAQLESDKLVPFSLILVQQNENRGGVTEIGRTNNVKAKWEPIHDDLLGLTMDYSDPFVVTLKPGVYRVEVSTPDNVGKYVLIVGQESVDNGYFSELSNVRTIQSFFGKSMFSMLKSSYVYYPIGIVVLLIVIYQTWRRRQQISNINHA
ncbi:MAG: hypothetical protein H6779_05425 [Candidatus Nomurabacteria bacterium]|nr:MAG: hypothetical protein H6779_05425 [Candidatus Nomurabacteria bacterium]